MRILASIAALSVSVLAQRQNVVFLDESTPCSDFDEKFGSFDGMKTKCKGKSNKKKTKQFCNLICENGHANVWSTKPIKVTSKNKMKILNCIIILYKQYSKKKILKSKNSVQS